MSVYHFRDAQKSGGLLLSTPNKKMNFINFGELYEKIEAEILKRNKLDIERSDVLESAANTLENKYLESTATALEQAETLQLVKQKIDSVVSSLVEFNNDKNIIHGNIQKGINERILIFNELKKESAANAPLRDLINEIDKRFKVELEYTKNELQKLVGEVTISNEAHLNLLNEFNSLNSNQEILKDRLEKTVIKQNAIIEGLKKLRKVT